MLAASTGCSRTAVVGALQRVKITKEHGSRLIWATGSESDIDHILARRQQTKEGKDCNLGDEGCTEFSYKPIGAGSNGEVPGHSVKIICDSKFEFQLCSI
jgi:hypothetical protein